MPEHGPMAQDESGPLDIARLLLRTGRQQAEAVIKDDPDSPTAGLMQDIVKGAPLRLLLMVARGNVSLPLLRALLLLCNGKYGRGLAALVRATFRRRPRRLPAPAGSARTRR